MAISLCGQLKWGIKAINRPMVGVINKPVTRFAEKDIMVVKILFVEGTKNDVTNP